jgi:phosphoglycolate phosphatase
VVGEVTGLQKSLPMLEHQVEVYVGDHPLDMEGARSARVPGIGVATGAHSRQQLLDAGATWAADSLTEIVPALT